MIPGIQGYSISITCQEFVFLTRLFGSKSHPKTLQSSPSKRMNSFFRIPPWRLTWNMSSWRFGSDHFRFFSWVICRWTMFIFQGVKHYKLLASICLPTWWSNLCKQQNAKCATQVWRRTSWDEKKIPNTFNENSNIASKPSQLVKQVLCHIASFKSWYVLFPAIPHVLFTLLLSWAGQTCLYDPGRQYSGQAQRPAATWGSQQRSQRQCQIVKLDHLPKLDQIGMNIEHDSNLHPDNYQR